MPAQAPRGHVGSEPRRTHPGQHDWSVAEVWPRREIVEQRQQHGRFRFEIGEEGSRVHDAEPTGHPVAGAEMVRIGPSRRPR
jgi:hypothetical protein